MSKEATVHYLFKNGLLLLSMLFISMQAAQPDPATVDVTFDLLFPPCACEPTITLCMSLLHDIDLLGCLDTQSDRIFMMDALLGKMVRLRNNVQHLMLLHQADIQESQVEHLLHLLSLVQTDCKIVSDEHRALSMRLLEQMHSALQSFFPQVTQAR